MSRLPFQVAEIRQRLKRLIDFNLLLVRSDGTRHCTRVFRNQSAESIYGCPILSMPYNCIKNKPAFILLSLKYRHTATMTAIRPPTALTAVTICVGSIESSFGPVRRHSGDNNKHRKCGADAYLNGGAGKALNSISGTPHPYGQWCRAHQLFMADDECLPTRSSMKYTRFPFKVKAYTFINM